jgi:hypothetical protein
MVDFQEENIKKTIKDILENGSIILSDHSKKRMKERSFAFSDIKHILKKGNVTETTVYKGQTRYTMCGEDLEGDLGEVIIEMREGARKLIVITVK